MQQGLVVSVHCAEAGQQAVLAPDAGSEGGQQADPAVSEAGEGGQAQLPGEGDAGSDDHDSPVDPEDRLVALITQLEQALQVQSMWDAGRARAVSVWRHGVDTLMQLGRLVLAGSRLGHVSDCSSAPQGAA